MNGVLVMSAATAEPDIVVTSNTENDTYLPSPPSDDEVYWYFGPQHRWVPTVVSLSYTFTAVSLFRFALRHPALWVFLAVFALNAAGFALSLVDGQRARRLTREGHELLVRAWRPVRIPGVDVFLPTCGEPLAVLRNAYRHVAALDWPGPLTVWVLDDADRPQVRALAEAHGFEYLVRPDRGHQKKAGNLNHALGVSRAEVVAILDADFCPRPDFLRHLVPYLDQPDVGIVQSPQHFDTGPELHWLQRAAGAAQEWFFRWLQPSRDASDAAICCGSNAVYRRAALDRIGGFARLDHSEDMYTGLELLRHGYRTRYVPVLLATGLSPDNLSAFVNQQYRWALGNLWLLLYRGLRRMPAPVTLRVAYCNGVLSYLLSAVNVFVAPLPPLVMMFWYPTEIRPWHVLPLVAPAWVWFVLLPTVSRTRWRVEVIRAHLMVSFAAAAAVWHTVRRRSATWTPTGQLGARSRLARRVGSVALSWLAVTTVGAWLGLFWDVAHYGLQRYWGVAGYVAMCSYLTVPLIVELWRASRPAIPSRLETR
jgi:cellulose synthase (UDP-forming)